MFIIKIIRLVILFVCFSATVAIKNTYSQENGIGAGHEASIALTNNSIHQILNIKNQNFKNTSLNKDNNGSLNKIIQIGDLINQQGDGTIVLTHTDGTTTTITPALVTTTTIDSVPTTQTVQKIISTNTDFTITQIETTTTSFPNGKINISEITLTTINNMPYGTTALLGAIPTVQNIDGTILVTSTDKNTSIKIFLDGKVIITRNQWNEIEIEKK